MQEERETGSAVSVHRSTIDHAHSRRFSLLNDFGAALARPTTAWVPDTALAQLAAWHAAGLDMPLSINVSGGNLEEGDFAAQVQLYLMEHRVRPRCLEFVAESVESAEAADLLQDMAAMGRRVVSL